MHPNRITGIILICLSLIAYTTRNCVFSRTSDGFTQITFLDVGQGDSIIIQIGREIFLIDAGGPFENNTAFQKEIVHEITSRNGFYLNHAIISHPDRDHIQGFIYLLSKIKIQNIYVSTAFREPFESELLTTLIQLSKNRGTQIHWIDRATNIHSQITVFPSSLKRSLSANNLSLITTLKFGKCSALFLGDLETASEKYWLPKLTPPYDILKVAHHGSRGATSFSLLRHVHAKLAVVQSGAFNTYGHPHPQIFPLFQVFNIPLLRTDNQGAVELRISEQGDIACHSHIGSCGFYTCG